MDGTVLVDARRTAHKLVSLDMKCDGKDIPEPLDGSEPIGWWLAGDCTFGGSLSPVGETDTLGDPVEGTMKGQAAIAIGDGRVIGIMSPASQTAAALWWAWPLSSTKITAVGTQGLFKKRPTAIRLDRNGGADAEGDTLILKVVTKLYRKSGKFQSAQEASLFEALTA
jgi:hypothetical protein